MNKVTLILFFFTAEVFAAQDLNALDSVSDQISGEQKQMIEGFFTNVLLERNLDRAMEYFVEFDDYKGSSSNQSVPAKLIHINYDMRKSEYIADCERMMNLLPRQGIGNIKIIHLKRNGTPSVSGPTMIEVLCSYDLSGGQFRFVAPLVVEKDGSWRFKSRFGSLMEFVR